MISKADIEKAYAAIRPYIVRTPTVYSQKLSDLCRCQTFFKLENLQMTGSFKERGALNKLLRLSSEEKKRGVVTVEEDEIANAILLLLEIEKIVAEGAGAVALAALLNRKVALPGKKVLSVISGGNIDVNILDKIIMRGLMVEGRIAQLTVRLNDRPGSLIAVLDIIKRLQVNILDIIHHRLDSPAPFGYVDVSITLETKGHDHIQEIKQALKEGGYPV